MVKLQVVVSDECWTCAEARRVVADVADRFPDVTVELVDMQSNERPDAVFAVPTYLLNGRVIFLGNPTRLELSQKLAAACHASQS
jgi:hypothetical protein